MLSQTGGHGDDWLPSGDRSAALRRAIPAARRRSSTGPTRCAGRSASCIRTGADVIKVATSGGVLSPRDDPRHAHFRPAELEVLVEEATAAGMFVMAHAQATDGIKNAIRAGIRSIEHGIYLDDEAIELMLGARHLARADARRAAGRARRRRRRRRSSPPAVVDKARDGDGRSTGRRSGARSRPASRSRWAPTAASRPHGRNLRELELMVEGGMTPAAALEATTRIGGRAAGRRRRARHDRAGQARRPRRRRGRPVRRRDSRRAGRAGLEGRRPGRVTRVRAARAATSGRMAGATRGRPADAPDGSSRPRSRGLRW